MLTFDRVTFDPAVLGGRACIRGMRITVSLVVNLIANGMTIADVVRDYPYLEADDVRQALQYVAWLADESVYPAKTGRCPARSRFDSATCAPIT